MGFMYDIVFINQKQCSLDIWKHISKKTQIDRNFKLTPPFLNEAGLLSHDFEKELLTKKVTVRKMPYLPPTTNSFARDSYDHQLKKFTKDVSNHTSVTLICSINDLSWVATHHLVDLDSFSWNVNKIQFEKCI